MVQILKNNTNAVIGTCPTATSPLPQTVVDCYSEFLPTTDYTGFGGNASPPRLNFRATVRDGNPGAGGVSSADTTLLLTTAGPFLVTSLGGSGITLPGGSAQTITWDVAGTNTPSLAEAVKISLSSDGGMTYPTVLAGSTSNDGSHTVVLPNPTSPLTESRVKVEAFGNIFFDVNDAHFTIDPARYYLSPGTTLASAQRLSGARVVPPPAHWHLPPSLAHRHHPHDHTHRRLLAVRLR